MNEIAAKLKKVVERYGPESVVITRHDVHRWFLSLFQYLVDTPNLIGHEGGGVVVVGILIPLAIGLVSWRREIKLLLVTASMLALIGALMLRIAVLQADVFEPVVETEYQLHLFFPAFSP